MPPCGLYASYVPGSQRQSFSSQIWRGYSPQPPIGGNFVRSCDSNKDTYRKAQSGILLRTLKCTMDGICPGKIRQRAFFWANPQRKNNDDRVYIACPLISDSNTLAAWYTESFVS